LRLPVDCPLQSVDKRLTVVRPTLVQISRWTFCPPLFLNVDHKKFVDLVSDNRIVVATYVQLARDAARIGAYADMMHSEHSVIDKHSLYLSRL
jgi:hypothetical protein